MVQNASRRTLPARDTMPQDPLKPCRICGTATRARYCEECKPEANKRSNVGRRDRRSAHARGYDQAHRNRRRRHLRRHPICAKCSRELATVLDHIVRLEDGGSPSSLLNLQGLCFRCHGDKTRLEAAGRYDVNPDQQKAAKREAERARRKRGHNKRQTTNPRRDTQG